MLSDSIFESIVSILQAVRDYDYSPDHKNRIVMSLTHLYLVQWTLDRLHGDMNSTYYDARKYATEQFNLARAGLHPHTEDNY